jgi:diguanylate cyclase (GGDEF)-like protein/PAS domain S-box-containing protein
MNAMHPPPNHAASLGEEAWDPVPEGLGSRSAAVLRAVVIVAVAGLLQAVFWEAARPYIWLFMYPAVFLAALTTGIAGGLVGTGLAVAIVLSYFLPLRLGHGVSQASDLYSVIAFVTAGVGSSLLARRLQKLASRLALDQGVSQSAARIRCAFSRMPAPMLLFDTGSGRLLEANQAAQRLFGRKLAELKAQGRAAIWDAADPRMGALMADRESRQQYRGPATALIADGQRIEAEFAGVVFKDLDGRMIEVVYVEDLSLVQRNEHRLKYTADRLACFVAHAPAALAVLDREMRYVAVSERWKQDYHLGSDCLVGRSHYEVFPEVPQAWKDVHQRALAGAVLRKEGERFVRANGREQYVTWEVRPWNEPSGEIGGIVILTEDVTDITRESMALARSERMVRVLQARSGVGVWCWNMASGEILCSEPGLAIHRLPPAAEAAHSVSYELWRASFHPVDAARLDAELAVQLERGDDVHLELRLAPQESAPVTWVALDALAERDGDGHVTELCGTTRDITNSRGAEQRVRVLSAVVEQAPLGIIITDARGNIEFVNEAFSRVTGWTRAEVIGHNPRLLASGRSDKETYRKLWESLHRGQVWRGELLNRRRNGSEYLDSVTISPILGADGATQHFVSIHEDISRRRAAEARIEFLAHHDLLTGLANRTLARERFALAHALAERARQPMAVVALGVDRFSATSDALGVEAGSFLLRELARRLSAMLPDPDLLARESAEEFVALVVSAASPEDVARLIEKLRHAVREPIEWRGQQLDVSLSAGVAQFPVDGRDFDTLFQNAETALNVARSAGGDGARFFDENFNARAVASLNMRSALRRALKLGEFRLAYQPRVDLGSGRILGVEALLRWSHPGGREIPPGEFIPAAEESGLIVPIGEWVLYEACRWAQDWRSRHPGKELYVAVNLSAVQFRRGRVEPTVHAALAATGLPPTALELEITESVLIEDVEGVQEVLKRLGAQGVRFAIDDFGTGYSSLSYLRRMAVHTLKIDRTFVSRIRESSQDAEIVYAILQMARALGLRTTAEGVEEVEIAELLRSGGCDEAQGYLFSPPLKAAAVEDLLEEDALSAVPGESLQV